LLPLTEWFFSLLSLLLSLSAAARPLRLYQFRAIVNRVFEPFAQFLWRLRYFALPAMIVYAVETTNAENPLYEISYSAVFLPPPPQ
jgi:hypothetical protein